MRERSALGVAPVRSAQETPAASISPPTLRAYWPASTSVGAIIAAWVPVSATAARASAATTVLPVPTSPRSMRFIGRADAMSESTSAVAFSWSAVRTKGSLSRSRARWAPLTTCSFPGRASTTWWRRTAIPICTASSSSYASRRRAASSSGAPGGKWIHDSAVEWSTRSREILSSAGRWSGTSPYCASASDTSLRTQLVDRPSVAWCTGSIRPSQEDSPPSPSRSTKGLRICLSPYVCVTVPANATLSPVRKRWAMYDWLNHTPTSTPLSSVIATSVTDRRGLGRLTVTSWTMPTAVASCPSGRRARGACRERSRYLYG
jgi:hypothetical protein